MIESGEWPGVSMTVNASSPPSGMTSPSCRHTNAGSVSKPAYLCYFNVQTPQAICQ